MGLTLMFIVLAIALVAGVPVAIALAGASLVYILIDGVPQVVLIHNMVNGVDSFPLLAVPFFVLAGHLMNTAGITNKIFTFARALVGWMHGGLGTIEIKAMRDAGYDTDFSVGITAASSTIGPIIPPSLPLVIYGVMASASVGELFAAGIIPGLLMAFSLMVMVAWYARRRNYPRDASFELLRLWTSFKQAFFPLLTPVIIIGGIVTGAFTPTESAVAAVTYALFLGLFVYRTLTWRHIVRVSMDTIETSASILLIVAAAAIFAWVLTANQVADLLGAYLLSISENPQVLLAIITVLVLLVGLFMETIAAITILVPVLLPIANTVGIDPVHLGIIVILNLMLGLLTPPVGMVLYVLSQVSGVKFERCVTATMPFLVPLVLVLLVVTFVPEFSLWLPTLIYR